MANSQGRPAIRVLLVEDDPEIARRLVAALAEASFVVEHAGDGETGLLLGRTNDFDAVVLDLGLPRLPGLEVLKQWRREGRDMPVLVLTARDAWTDRVDGLNAGADDYLGKPFQNAEVVARLRALTRRSAGRSSPVMRRGDIVLDPEAGTVQRGDEAVELTPVSSRSWLT
jgi:two-component system OmpR family response regulator